VCVAIAPIAERRPLQQAEQADEVVDQRTTSVLLERRPEVLVFLAGAVLHLGPWDLEVGIEHHERSLRGAGDTVASDE